MSIFGPAVSPAPTEFAPGIANLVAVGLNGAGAEALLKSSVQVTGYGFSALSSLAYNNLASNADNGVAGVNAQFETNEFQIWKLTAASAAVTISPIQGRGTLVLIQDATGGRLVTWPAEVRWPGAAPALSVGANAVDVFEFVMWYQNVTGTWNYFATYWKGFTYA